jgi:hypothetical protein
MWCATRKEESEVELLTALVAHQLLALKHRRLILAGFLRGLLFHSENGVDIFLRNVMLFRSTWRYKSEDRTQANPLKWSKDVQIFCVWTLSTVLFVRPHTCKVVLVLNYAMKAYGGGCIDRHFLDLRTSWR